MSNDVNDFLFQSSAKSFPFDHVGDIVRGTIISAEIRQQTSLEDGKALFWDDGKPRNQLVIVLQTTLSDGDDDDGQRTIYAKGGRFEVATGEGLSMRDAIADAVKAAGAKSLDPGDELAVGFTGEGKGRRGFNPPKLYSASFRKASKAVSGADLFGDATPIDTGV